MKNCKNGCVLVVLSALMLAAAPAHAPTSEVLTLISPNEEAKSYFGYSVAVAGGDVNQDGTAAVIVGAFYEDPGGSPEGAGRAYIFGGQDGSLLFELVSPNEEVEGRFGISVSSAGDANKDGIADVIVGAPQEAPGTSPSNAGRAYVFSGHDGSLLIELASPNEEARGGFGDSVASAGDIDQDGHGDVVVGAPGEQVNTGRAYVYSGRDGSLLLELASPNQVFGGDFGTSISGTGDVNQDGVADLIVGADGEDPDSGPSQAGRAYLFSGVNGTVLFELVSPNAQSLGKFGNSVAGAGDVNQDAIADVIVGARSEGFTGFGRAYVFSGQDGSLLLELESPNRQGGGSFGHSVAGAGDVNRDGAADVIVGAVNEDPGTSPQDAGRAYVMSGQDGSMLMELASPNEEAGGGFGSGVAAADVNQDGLADPIVGAFGETLVAGRAYVFWSSGALRINSGGPNYTDIDGSLFVADRAYAPGSFGYIGGAARHFDQPIGGTDDDLLYQDVRLARSGPSDGSFSYRFDVAPGRYDVTLFLMAPALDGPGNVVMDVRAEEDLVFDDLDVTAEAGGAYQALVKTFAVDVTDGTLVLRFRAENKAAVVSAIAVAAQAQALGRGERHRPRQR